MMSTSPLKLYRAESYMNLRNPHLGRIIPSVRVFWINLSGDGSLPYNDLIAGHSELEEKIEAEKAAKRLLDGESRSFSSPDTKLLTKAEIFADELFTLEQAVMLADYLKMKYEITLNIIEVPIPISMDACMPFWDWQFRLELNEDYDLPFNAGGVVEDETWEYVLPIGSSFEPLPEIKKKMNFILGGISGDDKDKERTADNAKQIKMDFGTD